MPITDFDAVWHRPGDLPSQIDVFNGDAVANRLQDHAEYLQQLGEGLSAADRHKFGTGDPAELEVDLSKVAEDANARAEETEETEEDTDETDQNDNSPAGE